MAALFKFKVEGSGWFPTDMLRYDEAWPLTDADVLAIGPDRTEMRQVTLGTSNPRGPTKKRWESFTWRLVKIGVDIPTLERAR